MPETYNGICSMERAALNICFAQGSCSSCVPGVADWLYPSVTFDNCNPPSFQTCSSLVHEWDDCMVACDDDDDDGCKRELEKFCICSKEAHINGDLVCDDYLSCFDGCASIDTLKRALLEDEITSAPSTDLDGRVEICPTQRDALYACLRANNADTACQSCLTGAENKAFDVIGDVCTCTSCEEVSAQVCLYLNNPTCPCPVEECESALKHYFGCFKKTLTAADLGCDNALPCTVKGPCRSGVFACLISNIIASLISSIFGGGGGGGGCDANCYTDPDTGICTCFTSAGGFVGFSLAFLISIIAVIATIVGLCLWFH